jgi:hypothetical protein
MGERQIVFSVCWAPTWTRGAFHGMQRDVRRPHSVLRPNVWMEEQILEVAQSLPSCSMLLYTTYCTDSGCIALNAPAKSAFCQWISQQTAEYPAFPVKVSFTEISCSTRTGITNIQHKHVWPDKILLLLDFAYSNESVPPSSGLECYVTALEALTIYCGSDYLHFLRTCLSGLYIRLRAQFQHFTAPSHYEARQWP